MPTAYYVTLLPTRDMKSSPKNEGRDFSPGKIYGVMDDLRLEHQRVQEKYVAMTKALIESCDIDAFRVDPWTEG